MQSRRCRLLSLVVALLFAVPAAAATVSGDLQVFVLNVGQGDAILIVCPHGTHRMLIDTGARGYPGSQDAFQKQLRALVPGGNQAIAVVVVTHPHEDHVGGLEWVLTNFKVKKLIDSGHPLTPSFAAATKVVKAQVKAGTLQRFQAKLFPPKSVADFCPATNLTAELLLPKGYGKAANANNNSVSVLVSYGSKKLLFTGDAERAAEKLLLADPATASRLTNISFYKVGHHGAETSSTPDFLDAITPAMAGASSGCKNVAKNKGYRHPRAATLDALETRIGGGSDARTLHAGDSAKGKWRSTTIHTGVYTTPTDDTFVIVTDGSGIARRTPAVAGAMGRCPVE
jgi:beta-lactamase superfamily II metal-dependent hydrolase